MQRVQAEKLQHQQEQKEHTGKAGNEQVLPFLPKAHRTHRNEVTALERMGWHGK
jgi:hypothetical protein